MPRLRNAKTGVEVSVSDTTALRLVGYVPVEDKRPAPKRAAAKSDEK